MALATAYERQDHGVVLKDADDVARFRTGVSRRLAPDQALIVTFEARGHAVYLGLHGELGFVHVTPIPDSPPYLITVGDPGRHDVIEFMLHGEHSTEIEARHLVPASEAWRAVGEFLVSGNLLQSLDWTQV
jgi:hypothetical protein